MPGTYSPVRDLGGTLTGAFPGTLYAPGDTRITDEMVPVLPLDNVENIVIVTPEETPQYGGGAILLFSAGWIGR